MTVLGQLLWFVLVVLAVVAGLWIARQTGILRAPYHRY